MRPSIDSSLLEEMYAAALLPPEHDTRHAVEARVIEMGEEAEARWLAILQEDEELRLSLHHIETPENLHARLLRIPEETPRRPVFARFRPLLATAAALVAVTGLVLLVGQDDAGPDRRALQAITLMAADDHANDRSLAIRTADRERLSSELLGTLPFVASLPDLGSDFALAGGRASQWGGFPVAYSLWERSRETYSLIEFRAGDLHLPATMPRMKVCCDQYANAPFDVVIWTEKGRGYALVSTHKAMADVKGKHVVL